MWAQFGAFSVIMNQFGQSNEVRAARRECLCGPGGRQRVGKSGKRVRWLILKSQGPWDYDEETLGIYRTFAKLHMQLYPYLRRLTHQAAHRGLPPMRPMALAFQTDAQACSKV